MAQTFKSWDVDQVVLLPPSVQELVPAGHRAHFVRDRVREARDVSAILKPSTEDRGFPPYDPTMMTALLLYAYRQGVYASRRIAKACEERVDVMAVPARQSPDFRTSSGFRKRHLPARGGRFTQVLPLGHKAGLVRVGHVALDGTKIHASAAHEDAAYGVDRRGDELPEWVTTKQQRVEKIRAAKAAVEAEAQANAPGKKRTAELPSERPRRGRPAKNPPGMSHARAQRNFTDPDSRILEGKKRGQATFQVDLGGGARRGLTEWCRRGLGPAGFEAVHAGFQGGDVRFQGVDGLLEPARIIHDASATSADTRLCRADSPFSPSTYCTSMPQGFTPPSARLASRLHAFATNLHE